MKKITILGATGSIGMSTLDVISHHRDEYEVFALTAHKQVERLVAQCQQFNPRFVVLTDVSQLSVLRQLLSQFNLTSEVLVGEEGLETVAAHPEVDIVMAAIVGAAGLTSTLAALKAGKKVLLANKESLVMAGELVLDYLQKYHGQLIPVDSEHSALFQSLPVDFMSGRLYPHLSNSIEACKLGVNKLVLTASGGAVRDLALSDLSNVSPAFACTHPNWSMGKKVTVDSASMMNKALEVIEAYYLFGLPIEKIEVVLHPQSVIHSLVYYDDGSVLSQLGNPDMRTPIACALAWPERISTKVATLDLTQNSPLTFAKLDVQRYPCLTLAYQALRAGGLAATVLNAANEVAVECFLEDKIRFTDIYALNKIMLETVPYQLPQNLDNIQATDQLTRQLAHEWVEKKKCA